MRLIYIEIRHVCAENNENYFICILVQCFFSAFSTWLNWITGRYGNEMQCAKMINLFSELTPLFDKKLCSICYQNMQRNKSCIVDGLNTVCREHFCPVISLPTHLFIIPNIVRSPPGETSITF